MRKKNQVMYHMQQWFWLPKQLYPNNQNTNYSGFADNSSGNYTVAEFLRTFEYSEPIISAELTFSGDTLFQLFCSGECIATGPAAVGGDFRANDQPCRWYYSLQETVYPCSNCLELFARVQMLPYQLCDYSKGHGGFMLYGTITLASGAQHTICTDENWLARKNKAFLSPRCYDSTLAPDPYITAQIVPDIWNTTVAPIPVRREHELFPKDCRIHLQPGEKLKKKLELDHIYAGFLRVLVKTHGIVKAQIICREFEEQHYIDHFTFTENTDYRGFTLFSAGNILAVFENCSDFPTEITISFIATCYPVAHQATITTDDPDLNALLAVCKHTLQYCRQTHHLDSPRHCEPPACTGDYYNETLMTHFSFGDLRLAEFDLLRTAKMLEAEDGRLFHTS